MSWCGVAVPLEFKMVELGYRDIAKYHEVENFCTGWLRIIGCVMDVFKSILLFLLFSNFIGVVVRRHSKKGFILRVDCYFYSY